MFARVLDMPLLSIINNQFIQVIYLIISSKFTEETPNGKLHFLLSVKIRILTRSAKFTQVKKLLVVWLMIQYLLIGDE